MSSHALYNTIFFYIYLQRDDDDPIPPTTEGTTFTNFTIYNQSSGTNVTDRHAATTFPPSEAITLVTARPLPLITSTSITGGIVFYIIIVGVVLTTVIYVTSCTLLYFYLKKKSARYTVTNDYQLHNPTFSLDSDSSSTLSLPKYFSCLMHIWQIGTCKCCKCIAKMCLKTSNQGEMLARPHFA
jgi:hypothetical protein